MHDIVDAAVFFQSQVGLAVVIHQLGETMLCIINVHSVCVGNQLVMMFKQKVKEGRDSSNANVVGQGDYFVWWLTTRSAILAHAHDI